jgi:hypothetical protein
MKERPILYSAPMVLAKLAGRKTQTRRAIKDDWWRCLDPEDKDDRARALKMCHYGVPGDRLWGRETWAPDAFTGRIMREGRPFDTTQAKRTVFYRATEPNAGAPGYKTIWRPSIFMPRWASRLLDEVVSVRVERLQDITRDDAIAEGLERRPGSPNWFWPGGPEGFGDPCACYFRGWDMINGKGAAALNPWVWVVETRPVTSE